MQVLVVEDCRDSQQLFATYLRKVGHNIQVADSGEAAIVVAQRSRPDVVLCDICMPKVNGYQVASTLQMSRESKPPYLIATSGYFEETAQRALEAGFDAFLTKPIDFKQLDQILATIPSPDPACD